MRLFTVPPAEPDPSHWLSDTKLLLLERHLGMCGPTLRQAGLWRAALGYWVRWQASLEAVWPEDEEKTVMEQLEQDWLAKNSMNEACLDIDELRSKLRVAPAVQIWSRQQWGHRLETLYLQSKSMLDGASCRLLRLSNKNLAQELYHRIKAGESSFETLAKQFGEGPERIQGGLVPFMPLGEMPFGLAPLLERLEPGKLSNPLRLNQGFCLVQLEIFKPSKLDPPTEELLLAEQLRLWIDSVVDAFLKV